MDKPIKAMIKINKRTKDGRSHYFKMIMTSYHIKENPSCVAMYSSSTGKCIWMRSPSGRKILNLSN